MDLNTAWFLLFGVLIAGYAVLDGFDLGVGILSLFARDDRERRLHMNAIGPVWDGNEVWLLTGGGALFAAFPHVYATVFSGFYLALMLLLVALIARAVSFEFRSKVEDPRWRRTWDLAFGLGSLLPALLYGVAVGNVLRGVPIGPDREFAGTFLGLLNPFALACGLLSVAMFTAHGALWLRLKTEGPLSERAAAWALRGWAAWLALWVVGTALSLWLAPHLFAGWAGEPLSWVGLALSIGGLALLPLAARAGHWGRAFLASSAAVVGQVVLAGAGLWPRLLPALGDPSRSLDIWNAASTPRTLGVMLVIALIGMPVVVAYTAFIYRIFRGKVVLEEASY